MASKNLNVSTLKELVADLRRVYVEETTIFNLDSFKQRLFKLIKYYKLDPHISWFNGSEVGVTLVFDNGAATININLSFWRVDSISAILTKIYII